MIEVFDMAIGHLFVSMRNPWLDVFFLNFTEIGDWKFVLPLTAVIVFFFWNKGKYNYLFSLVVSAGIGEILLWFFKHLFARERPIFFSPMVLETDGSFPSGHAFVSFAFFGFLALIIARRIKNVFWRRFIFSVTAVFIILMGASRLYLGVHFASDVFVGWILGAAWLTIISKYFLKKENTD